MRLSYRLDQFRHVLRTIKLLSQFNELVGSLDYALLRSLIENGGYVMGGVSVERYVAMVKSFMGGNTIFSDVSWFIDE